MAEKLADRSESDRRKIVPEWGVAADDQIVLVAFVALLLILGTFAWTSWWSGDDDPLTATVGASAVSDDHEGRSEADLAEVETAFDINGRMNGKVAVLTGIVTDEATRDDAEQAALAVDGVDRVDNRLRLAATSNEREQASEDGDVASVVTTTTATPTTTAAPVVAAAVVAASSDGIVLSGTVPSQTAADELRTAALAIYTEDRIDDQLTVAEGAESFDLTLTGALGSQESVDALSASFAAAGAAQVSDELELDAAAAASAALNELFELEPVLFESGTDVILAESLPTLDRAAEILADHPEAAIQIGGHTDSRGGAESNLTLSQARADAVFAALLERGVTNELTAVGFGETELLIDPDDTPEAQQANRRIEFTPN